MKLSEDLICSLASAPSCLDRITGLSKPGYHCNPACEPCPSGFYSTDGKDCRRCSYGTSSFRGSSSCGVSFNITSPGLHFAYIPLNVNKISVKLRGGIGAYLHNQGRIMNGGFSSCNITVPANSTLYVIVGGDDRPANPSGYSRFSGETLYK